MNILNNIKKIFVKQIGIANYSIFFLRIFISLFLILFYAIAPTYIASLREVAIFAVLLYWIPVNKLFILIRKVLVGGLVGALIHYIPQEGQSFVESNLYFQPTACFIGCILGYISYLSMKNNDVAKIGDKNQGTG
jgi:hypothetical protein